MTTIWFVPVEGGDRGTITHNATEQHVDGTAFIDITSSRANAVVIKECLRVKYKGKSMEALIGGAEKWMFCYLAKKDAKNDEKATLNPRTVVVPDSIAKLQQVNTYELKPSAVIPSNNDDSPLLLVYPAKPPAGNSFFSFIFSTCLFE